MYFHFSPKKKRMSKNSIQKNKSSKESLNNNNLTLIFKDSFNFLSSSLDKITNSLKQSNCTFNILHNQMTKLGYSNEVIESIKQKGVFPYEWFTDLSKLNETSLPPKNMFFSTLKNSGISNEEYDLATSIYEKSKCKSMKDYLLLYLFCDVLILTEAFQKFREIIFNVHKLDPAHFVTLPSLSMESALFDSKIEIDLLNDITVFNEIENNICGGFTSVVQSRNTFNNPNLDNFDETQQLSSGVFLDLF